MPTMTIGLPVVDGMKAFELAVKSVFAQTHEDWKLIIVCDGSPASIINSASIIDDARVKVVAHAKNKGLAVRLNEISSMADTDYIIRMDSDDVMHPSRLAKLATFLDANPRVDVLGSGSYLVNEDYGVEGSYDEPSLPDQLSGYLKSGVFSHPTVAFKTKWAIDNPYDPSRVRTEDKELWLRAAPVSSYSKLPDRLLFCMVPRALSISKQGLTARYDRKLLREVGPSVAPLICVNLKIVESMIKQIVFRVFNRVGLLSVLYRTKFTTVQQSERDEAQATLDAVSQTAVPGWG